jgi:hypothetical protein
LCQRETCEKMCLCHLGEVARGNGCFSVISQSKLYRAYCCTMSVMGQCEGGHQWTPRSMLLVCQKTPSSRVNNVIGEASFWKAVRLERSVGRMMMYPIAPIAEGPASGPTTWGQRSFCEEEKIRGVVVQHRNDIDQGRAVGPRLLNVYGKEFEFCGRRGGGRRVVVCRGPSS